MLKSSRMSPVRAIKAWLIFEANFYRSWREIYELLCLWHDKKRFQNLERVLCDDSIRVSLKNFLNPFGPPTAKSRSAFQTKTAAINVTPSSNGDYDIEQIKEDALWLSENSKIDEISALRVVLLDWQQSPFDNFASRFVTSPNDEITNISLPTSSTVYTHRDSANERTLSVFRSPASHTFAESQRRSRQTYFLENEKSYILRVAVTLISVALSHTAFASTTEYNCQIGLSSQLPDWLLKEGTNVLKENTYGSLSTVGYRTVITWMEAFRSRLKRLVEFQDLPFDDEMQQPIASSWRMQKVEDLLYIIQLIIAHLESLDEIPTTKVLDTWFNICCDYEFFSSNMLVS